MPRSNNLQDGFNISRRDTPELARYSFPLLLTNQYSFIVKNLWSTESKQKIKVQILYL